MSTVSKCMVCNNETKTTCGKCKVIFYCTKECQIYDWSDKHKHFCPNLPILTPQSIIYAYKQVFMLILSKIRIFRIFNFFHPNYFILLLKSIQINLTNYMNKKNKNAY